MRILLFLASTLASLLGSHANEGASCEIFKNTESVCYLDSKNVVPHRFGTKTTLTENQRYRTYQRKYKVKGCKPIMFYLVSRHAIRYPDSDDIVEMQDVLPKLQQEISEGQGTLCSKDLKKIKEWQMRMKPEDDNNVSETGANETMALARKYRKAFKDLLDPKDAVIEIGVTNKIRTTQTAKAFLEGLKKEEDEDTSDGMRSWNPQFVEKDFLKFHDNCKKIAKKRLGKLPKPKQVKEFGKSELVKKLGERIQRRLGVTRAVDWNLIQLLRKSCSFEFALYKDAPWCAAFSQRDLEVLDYYEDLEDYLEDAYGSPLHRSSCQLVNDLLEKVTLSVKRKKPLRSYLYFTHAGALKRLWPGLGLFRDDGLQEQKGASEGFCERQHRQWRSSQNTPFGANFVAALFKCKHKENEEKFRLLTLVNGIPTTIGGCDDPACSVSRFLKHYNQSTSNCDLQNLCGLPLDKSNNSTEN